MASPSPKFQELKSKPRYALKAADVFLQAGDDFVAFEVLYIPFPRYKYFFS